jgi:hypothetical protein
VLVPLSDINALHVDPVHRITVREMLSRCKEICEETQVQLAEN